MHEEIEAAPGVFQRLEDGIQGCLVFHIRRQHQLRADALRQRGHPPAERLALIGKGQIRALCGAGLGNAPGDRVIIGDAHHEAALALH